MAEPVPLSAPNPIAIPLELLKSIDVASLDWKNPVSVALQLAQRIESIPGLAGPQKMEMLKRALTHLAKTAGVYSPEFEVFLENVLPSVLQAAVAVSKGQFSLKTIDVNCCLGVLQSAIALLSKK